MIKTISLEKAKELRDVGWSHETEKSILDLTMVGDVVDFSSQEDIDPRTYYTPTISELLDVLPKSVDTIHNHKKLIYEIVCIFDDGEFMACYGFTYGAGEYDFIYECKSISLEDALASLWIKLKEEGLVN